MKPGGKGPWRRLYLTGSHHENTAKYVTQLPGKSRYRYWKYTTMLFNLCLYMFEQSFQNNVLIKIKNRMPC